MNPDAPFVGRAAELDALLSAQTTASQGRARTVLVAGDAGVGKTSLLAEFADRARAAGAFVLLGHCIDLGAAGLPYLALTEALRPVVDRITRPGTPGRPGLRALLSLDPPTSAGPREGFGGSPAVVANRIDEGPGDGLDVGRVQLFDEVAELLTTLAETTPVVLLIEDVHWADPSTRDLLRYLVGRLRHGRLLTVLSYRSDDLHRTHPARRLLTELPRLPHVHRLEVRPFSSTDLHDFLHALAGRDVPESTVRRIMARSEGNAFFAAELLAAGGGPGVPNELADVLLAALDRVGPTARLAVRAAAVGGRRVSDQLLEQVVGLPPGELDEALREAVEHRLLHTENDRYAFRHALVREAVYTDLLPGERCRWHAAYADALREEAGTVPGVYAELAHHSRAANDLPGALSALVAAAGEASALSAPREAMTLLEQALALYDSVPDAAARTGVSAAALHLDAARTASRSGALDRALDLARCALETALDEGDPTLVTSCRLRLATDLIEAERPGEATVHTARALAELPDEAPDTIRAAALAGHARALMVAGEGDPGPVAEQALALAGDLDLPAIRADALVTLAVTELAAGANGAGGPDDTGSTGSPASTDGTETARGTNSAKKQEEQLRTALDLARRAGAGNTELRAALNLANCRLGRGELAGALSVLESAVARAAAAGVAWSPLGVELRYLRHHLRFLLGRWDDDEDVAGCGPSDAQARLAVTSLAVAVHRGGERAAAALAALTELQDGALRPRDDLFLAARHAEYLRLIGRPLEAADRAAECLDRAVADMVFYQVHQAIPGIGALEVGALADLAEPALRHGDSADVMDLTTRATRRRDATLATMASCPNEKGALPTSPSTAAELLLLDAEYARFPADSADRPDPVDAWRRAHEAFGQLGQVYATADAALGLARALLVDAPGDSDARREAEGLLDAADGTAAALGAQPLAQRVAAERRRAGLPPARPGRATAVADREALGRAGTERGGAGRAGASRGGAGRAGPERGGTGRAGTAPGGAARGSDRGRPGNATSAPGPELTAREQAVLRLAAAGRTNREIGSELFISGKTVSVHMSNAMAKLGASGRTEAVATAHRLGLLPLEPADAAPE